MTMPDPTVELRAFAGHSELGRPVLELRPGTWDALVTVRPIQGGRGQLTEELRFMVVASWTGPPADGFPPSPVPVEATDYLPVATLELGKAVAMAATDELRAARVPDLRRLKRRFDARA